MKTLSPTSAPSNEMFCRFCGSTLGAKDLSDGSTEKYCSICDYVFFRALTPAVIIFITAGQDILLTRSIGWIHPYWGFVAGHIEPGENAEAAASREAQEEVGIELLSPRLITTYAFKADRDILMLAFQAQANTKNIRLSQELYAAEWFNLSDPLPLRPQSPVIPILKTIFPHVIVANS